jgi:hypothetical protein
MYRCREFRSAAVPLSADHHRTVFRDDSLVYYSIVSNVPNLPRNLCAQAAGQRESGREPEAAIPVSGLVSS